MSRRVHGEAGQRSHGGANHRNQQANQQRPAPRGMPLPSSVSAGMTPIRIAVITISTAKACKIDVRVRVSGENAGQIEAFHAAANHMVGGFIIEEKIVVKPVN